MDIRFGENIWNNNQLLLSSMIFREMNRCKVTFKELKDFETAYINCRNNFFKGAPYNSEIYLQKGGKKFAFGIFENNFYLWHDTNESLGNCQIDINSIPDEEFINWIEEKINNNLQKKVNCSDCGKLINEKEIAGRYFAGMYCKNCWESKWKDIEAKETYN